METPHINERGEEKSAQPATSAEQFRKTAVIIGGSSGIGYETALKLIGRNYNVVNISRTPCPLARVKNYAADVTVGATMEKALALTAEREANLFALIYCAGFSMAAPIEYADPKDYRYLFEVNYFGALRAIGSFVPHIKKKGGRIVLIGSMGAQFPVAFDSFYSASKAALSMLAKSADIELSPYHIRVSCVQPGGTATGFTFKRKVYPSEESKEYSRNLKKASDALADMEQGGMNAGDVGKLVADILAMKRPPHEIACGRKNRLLSYAGRVLPENFSSYLNKKAYKQ